MNKDYVCVPKSELAKLEESRKQLWEFLEDKLTDHEVVVVTNLTSQIWKVANRTKWGT